jgi:hypothetical protein
MKNSSQNPLDLNDLEILFLTLQNIPKLVADSESFEEFEPILRELIIDTRKLRKTAVEIMKDEHNINVSNFSVIGEFSAGKSSFLNWFLGHPELLPAKMKPTTKDTTLIYTDHNISEPKYFFDNYPISAEEFRDRVAHTEKKENSKTKKNNNFTPRYEIAVPKGLPLDQNLIDTPGLGDKDQDITCALSAAAISTGLFIIIDGNTSSATTTLINFIKDVQKLRSEDSALKAIVILTKIDTLDDLDCLAPIKAIRNQLEIKGLKIEAFLPISTEIGNKDLRSQRIKRISFTSKRQIDTWLSECHSSSLAQKQEIQREIEFKIGLKISAIHKILCKGQNKFYKKNMMRDEINICLNKIKALKDIEKNIRKYNNNKVLPVPFIIKKETGWLWDSYHAIYVSDIYQSAIEAFDNWRELGNKIELDSGSFKKTLKKELKNEFFSIIDTLEYNASLANKLWEDNEALIDEEEYYNELSEYKKDFVYNITFLSEIIRDSITMLEYEIESLNADEEKISEKFEQAIKPLEVLAQKIKKPKVKNKQSRKAA